jgi:DMSO reductase iron-sulfur subunit
VTASASRGFLFDLNQCTGCHACELACATENQLEWGHSWRQVVTFNEDHLPGIASYHLSLACNHCLDAPCEKHCPALAIDRDAATGAVLIDDARCIGCKYCSWACPYDAPRLDAREGIMTKCTWCHHRLAKGQEPACVERCPTTALGFGPLEGLEVVDGFPSTEVRPRLRFASARPARTAPETTWELPADVVAAFVAERPAPKPAISLRGEWPLLVFTLITGLLTGWTMAAVFGGPVLPLPWFAGLMAAAAGASTLHLGRKDRMARAVLNVRRSWLSREILAFGLFGAVTTFHLAMPSTTGLGPATALLGLALAFCIDRVYDLVRPGGPRLHSADVLLTALLMLGVLAPMPVVAVIVATLKLALYLTRFPVQRGLSWRAWALRPLRVSGLVAAVVLGMPETAAPSLWIALAVGEAIDRAQFYTELRVRSPRGQAAVDLARRVHASLAR